MTLFGKATALIELINVVNISSLSLQIKLLSNFSHFQCESEEIITNITEDSPPGTVIRMGYQKLQKSLQFYLSGLESGLFNIENNGTVVVREELSSYVSNEVLFLDLFSFFLPL